MKLLLLVMCLVGSNVVADRERIAPPLEPLSQEEVGQWVGKIVISDDIDKSIVRRGLISGQTALRADCARYLAYHGNNSDLPYLIDALSDESIHVGRDYSYAGMMTTRYWANVALIYITKQDLGFRWDDPIERRKKAITGWMNHWQSVKHQSVVANPIDELVARLDAGRGVWLNGGSPTIDLPQNSEPKEVVAEAIRKQPFDQGMIKSYQIAEMRQVQISNVEGENEQYTAALLRTDLGTMAIVFNFTTFGRWWARFYPVEEGKQNTPQERTSLLISGAIAKARVCDLADRAVEAEGYDLKKFAAPKITFDPATNQWRLFHKGIADPAPQVQR